MRKGTLTFSLLEQKSTEVTEQWFKKHRIRYQFFNGKPRGGNYHWIDNHIVRATRFEGKFTDMVREVKTVEVFESKLFIEGISV